MSDYIVLINHFEDYLKDSYKKIRSLETILTNEQSKSGKWLKKEIIGHLIDSCENNRQRIIRLEINNENNIYSDYNQDKWVSTQNYREMETIDIIKIFYYSNILLIHLFRHKENICETVFLFDNEKQLTIKQILESYIDHSRHHMQQIGF